MEGKRWFKFLKKKKEIIYANLFLNLYITMLRGGKGSVRKRTKTAAHQA